jgi:hypothetical protein
MSNLDFQRADSVSNPTALRQLSCLESLRERRGDVRCFTPALLVTHAHLPLDPAEDFSSRFPAAAALQPFCVELPSNAPPFFSGLPTTVLRNRLIDWNRRLYAIAAERAKECFDFLAGIGATGHNGFFASSVMYAASIPDPLSRATPRSAIDVTMFGVFSANKITYLAPRFDLPPILNVIDAAARLTINTPLKLDDNIESQFKQLKEEE